MTTYLIIHGCRTTNLNYDKEIFKFVFNILQIHLFRKLLLHDNKTYETVYLANKELDSYTFLIVTLTSLKFSATVTICNNRTCNRH